MPWLMPDGNVEWAPEIMNTLKGNEMQKRRINWQWKGWKKLCEDAGSWSGWMGETWYYVVWRCNEDARMILWSVDDDWMGWCIPVACPPLIDWMTEGRVSGQDHWWNGSWGRRVMEGRHGVEGAQRGWDKGGWGHFCRGKFSWWDRVLEIWTVIQKIFSSEEGPN